MIPGEPVLFKLKYPLNVVAGGGFFVHFLKRPMSLAWNTFGVKNGAATFTKFRTLIERYVPSGLDHDIGCTILTSPFFLGEKDWVPVPKDFSPHLVRGKYYDTDDTRTSYARDLWLQVQARLASHERFVEIRPLVYAPSKDVEWRETLIQSRLGQERFRVLVRLTYYGQCAVTGEKALPTLDAAHIRPVADGGTHQISNGLLLRTDIHKLFDRGYVSVGADHSFLASSKLKDEFENGEYYLGLAGTKLWLPRRTQDKPSQEFLQWHNDTVFRG